MRLHQKPPTSRNRLLQRHDLLNFVTTLYEGDLHAKRVLSLANATLGVLASASLAIHAVGRGLAQAMGTLTKHGVKQVDRLLSNRGVDVGTFFAYWTPYIVGARKEVIVALDWTSFAADGQDTILDYARGADFGGDTGATVWYKRSAHNVLATTEAPA